MTPSERCRFRVGCERDSGAQKDCRRVLAYVSGHEPFDGDRLLVTGRVGGEVSVEQAYEAARATGLSILANDRLGATSRR